MGKSRYKFTQLDQPHFMTLTVLNWIPVFTRPETVAVFFDSLQHLIQEGLKLYAYVVLENHIHLVAQSQNLEKDIARLKSFTSRQLLRYLQEKKASILLTQFEFYKKAHKNDRTYQFWQEGVHPELIHNKEMMCQKVNYIHENPVKRGYVDLVEHWRYSSARNYLGQEGMLEVCTSW